MLVKGLFTQISGSFGGLTGSHNRGGLYIRARTIPTDPGSLAQVFLRNIFGDLSNKWQTLLTTLQRTAWETYAANVPITGPLGDPLQLTGQQQYVRSNTGRVQAGLPRVDDGPTVFALGELSPVAITVAAGGADISVAYEDADGWVNEDDGALIILAAREQAQTVNFFKGPYRLAGTVLGDLALPPPSPQTVISQFTYAAGNRCFVQARSTRADGRLSTPQRVSVIAA